MCIGTAVLPKRSKAASVKWRSTFGLIEKSMWSTPSSTRLRRFASPSGVRPGGRHVTASGWSPASTHVAVCQVESLPPLTGITQSYGRPSPRTSAAISANRRRRASQSTSRRRPWLAHAEQTPSGPISRPGRVSGRMQWLQ